MTYKAREQAQQLEFYTAMRERFKCKALDAIHENRISDAIRYLQIAQKANDQVQARLPVKINA